jgi:hypothetical protein
MSRRETIKQAYEIVIEEYIGPFLKRSDFAEWGKHFRRKTTDTVFSVRPGLDICRDQGLVAVGIGVGYLKLATFLRRAPQGLGLGSVDEEVPVLIGTTLSLLVPPYEFIEWRISSNNDGHSLGSELVECLQRYAFPFFDRFQSIDHALTEWDRWKESKYLTAISDFHRAATYHIKGDREKARAIIESVIENADRRWQERQARSDLNERDRAKRFLAFLLTSPA